jgi:Protein of unknown function (DUF433)
MPQSETKLFQVRLTDAEKRCIKSLAAREGLTLRQAILQAFEAWEERLQSRGLPANWRLAEEAPSVTPGGDHVPGEEDTSRAWLRRAVGLDWSKCQAAQKIQGKTGSVWVARGTRVPVDAVLSAVAEGESFLEIAEVFKISLQQLIAILQFAAEHVGLDAPTK